MRDGRGPPAYGSQNQFRVCGNYYRSGGTTLPGVSATRDETILREAKLEAARPGALREIAPQATAVAGRPVMLFFPRYPQGKEGTKMKTGTLHTHLSKWAALLLLVLLAAAVVAAATGGTAAGTGEASAVAPQDVSRIESRLSLLEQRFYSIETTLRGLEQQTRLSGVTTSGATRDPEVGLLRAEAEALRLRLAEVECALVRIDERTLGASAKEARRKSGAGGAGDPCRLNADSPLRLSTRP